MYWQWPGWWVPHFEAGGELERKPAPRWWHLVGGEWRWKLREPALTNSSWIIIYKGEKWECHHHGREWVMSQYYDGMHSPQRSMATGRIWSEIFLMIQTIFMNQVLSHIMAWNETMGDRGAVTLRWSMVGWTGLITSRDVLLQTYDNLNMHCYYFNFSNLLWWPKLCKANWSQAFLFDNSHISWRRHASDKCIERFSSCLDWEKLTMAAAWAWWDVWYVTDSGFGRKQQESERDTEDQIEKNERPKKEMSHCVDNFTVVMSPHRNLLESIKSRILEQTGDKNPVTKNSIWDALFSRDFIHSCQVLLFESCALVFGSCFDVAHRKLCIVFLHC